VDSCSHDIYLQYPEAIRKASSAARKSMFQVFLKGTTIPHDVLCKYGACKVMMLPAKEGVGIIAGGPLRAVMELAGIQDIVSKCHGSTNPHNVLKATFVCLKTLRSPESVYIRRGKEIPVETEASEEVTEDKTEGKEGETE